MSEIVLGYGETMYCFEVGGKMFRVGGEAVKEFISRAFDMAKQELDKKATARY